MNKESGSRSISTPHLLDILDDDGTVVIDIRSVDAYNGWMTGDERRGGHIKGAKSLPYKWMRYIDWPDIVGDKGILSFPRAVVYGDTEEDALEVASGLQRLGHGDVRVYSAFVEEWTDDPGLPMESLPRHKHLVSAGWLKRLIDNGSAPTCEGGDPVICHCHYRSRDDYEHGHIPGAVDLDTNSLEDTVVWNRRSPGELAAALESKGIDKDSTVVLYGRFSYPRNDDPFPGSSAGHLGAMRCAFIMLYAGVKDVRVLNGGIQAWIDEGLPLSTSEPPTTKATVFGAEIPQNPGLAVDTEEAKRILASEDANLVCVRSWPELIGKVSGYNYIEKKGRIPGAVFGNCGSDAYHMENYRNLDHTTRECQEIERMWAEAGITPDKHNAFYCGTGWRGSEAFFNAWLLGWPRISVYDGGWFEWSRDDANPIETGEPSDIRISGRIYGI